jgi:predicted nucleic acid-binding protein
MEVGYLIDTNIFLEILLIQEKNEICKTYLNDSIGKIFMSDFSLHSIGVILFRNKKIELYKIFVNDVLPKVELVTLQSKDYYQVAEIANQFSLDFDDAYQVTVAKSLNLSISTMDNDFSRVDQFCKINFI